MEASRWIEDGACVKLGCTEAWHAFVPQKFSGEVGIWRGLRILVTSEMPKHVRCYASWEPHTGLRVLMSVYDSRRLMEERDYVPHYRKEYPVRCEGARNWWRNAYDTDEARMKEGEMLASRTLYEAARIKYVPVGPTRED